jgi:hypothetical protein
MTEQEPLHPPPGLLAVGFTPEQATLLNALLNALSQQLGFEDNAIRTDLAALRSVLMTKAVVTKAELEAAWMQEQLSRQAKIQSFVKLEPIWLTRTSSRA